MHISHSVVIVCVSHLPIVFHSALFDEETIEKALQLGMTDVFLCVQARMGMLPLSKQRHRLFLMLVHMYDALLVSANSRFQAAFESALVNKTFELVALTLAKDAPDAFEVKPKILRLLDRLTRLLGDNTKFVQQLQNCKRFAQSVAQPESSINSQQYVTNMRQCHVFCNVLYTSKKAYKCLVAFAFAFAFVFVYVHLCMCVCVCACLFASHVLSRVQQIDIF
jgi:hypothetical protein